MTRTRTGLLIGLALSLAAAPAALEAQSPGLSPAPVLPVAAAQTAGAAEQGDLIAGVRVNGISGDPGRFQRLRDLRTGPALERLRYNRDRETWLFSAELDRAGYRDGRYLVGIERFGRLRATFEWTQVPLFYSDTTRSPFHEASPGVFRLEDTIQAAVQNRIATIDAYAPEVQRFETRSRRDTAAARLTFWLTPQLDVRVGLTSTGRTGEQPWGAPFGINSTVELPAPVETRTNDVTGAAEWSNGRGMVRVAYDGSWFDNAVEALTWDNPLRVTDQTYGSAYVAGDASSQGRMALWPDSTSHTVSAAGALSLPRRSRAFALMSIGSWLQNDRLLPFTINTAIAPIPLPRETADAEVRITAMTYRFTSRPTNLVWVSGQYRLYDFDNRTPRFPVDQYVRVDGTAAASATGGSHPFGYTRHFADLDASFTPFRFVAFRVGYGQEHDDRTFRFFEETTDRTLRAAVDSAGLSWGSIRVQYDRSTRTGEGFDEQVFSEINEQVSLRQFDIANRTRHRVTGIVQLLPRDTIGLNASLAVGQEHRPDSAFGLQDNDLTAVTVGVDYTPADLMTAGVSYGYENYSTRQQSRQSTPGPLFDDPTRDWWTNLDEDVHTVSLYAELPRLTGRTSARASYEFVGSHARYLYEVRPDTTLGRIEQLPPVQNRFHVVRVDVRQTLTPRLAVGIAYGLDRYHVDDFALTPGTLNSPLIPGFVNLLSQWRPYDAHTGWLRLFYRW